MRHLLMLAATLSLASAAGTSAASAQSLDKNGRCHAANGQFAKAELCKGSRGIAPAAAAQPARSILPATAAGPAKALAPAAAAGAVYKLDAKGKCRDARGKMAKKALCKAA